MASDLEDERPAARRASGRVRKAVERLGGGNKTDVDDESDHDDDSDQLEQSDDEPEYSEQEAAPKPKRTKKSATVDTRNKSTNRKRATTKRSGKAAAATDESGAEDHTEAGQRATSVAKGDFKINNDNSIFNAVCNPNTALETTVDDWLESYQEAPGPAMAELVNFLLRCCGCNSSVDEHQAEDENGIVESLTDITDEFKHESNLAYPLVSKSKTYKKFRSSLASFLSRLYKAAATSEILYETTFVDLVQAWILVLSSSKIRAFRHTATVIALLSVSALNEVHLEVTKASAQASRAKEAEEKKGRTDKNRLKDFTKRVQQATERQKKVEELVNESYESVFVNRYRDSDAVIRSECISALGQWMKTNADYWLEGDYLRYIGWVLSDEAKEARRESIKSLFSLYAKESNINSLRHFTERFKNQLTHMAVGEVDLTVRVQAIHVLRQIEGHGLLDEEQRDEVAKLIFEQEKRVRNAAADFFAGVHKETVEQREAELETEGSKKNKKGKKSAMDELEVKGQIQLKVLAELLLQYGQALDSSSVERAQELSDSAYATTNRDIELAGLQSRQTRIAFAVEALWDRVEAVRDWQVLSEYLLMDHSDDQGTPQPQARRNKGRARTDHMEEEADTDAELRSSRRVNDPCRLTEEEGTILVQVLVSSLERVKVHAASAATKKEQEQQDEVLAELTQYMMTALPDLFKKHQTVSARIVDILAIPRVLSLELYAETDHQAAYATLWDEVIKQFTSHKGSDVLEQAVRTISTLQDTSALTETNSTKTSELEMSLADALREIVADKDVEAAAFDEDELNALASTLSRIDKLLKAHNLTHTLDDTDNGRHTSAWDIIDSLADRGLLGYRDEAVMVGHAIGILGTHFVWHLSTFMKENHKADAIDQEALNALVESRDKLDAKLESIAVGSSTNAAESVKQTALSTLLDLYVLCDSVSSPARDPDGQLVDLRQEMSDELQARCAGFIEAEIERYSEELASTREEDDEEAQSGTAEDDEGSDTDTGKRKSKKKSQKKAAKQSKDAGMPKRKSAKEVQEAHQKELKRLLAARRFEQVVHPFVRAIHAGTLDLQHATVLIHRFEHFGSGFDHWCKLLIQDLRDEGIYTINGSGKVVEVLTSTLKAATELYLDSIDDSASDDKLVALGRALVQATVVRGPQLAIVRKLAADEVVSLHSRTLSWIVPKIASYGEDRRTVQRNKALSLFKALGHLTLGVDGRHALIIKNHLDALLDEHNVEVSATSKTWEPVRAFKKRLLTAMSKDASFKEVAERKAATTKMAKSGKSGPVMSATDDEQDAEDNDAEGNEARQIDDELAQGEPTQNLGTPSRRKRADKQRQDENETASAVKRRKTGSRSRSVDLEHDQSDDENEVQSLLVGGPQRPNKSSPFKRPSDDNEEEEEELVQDEDEIEDAAENDDEAPPPASPSSQISLSDVKRRKKKARR
ncbi:cohesin complex subunit [Microbotryomycetes sp. JL221]|nr:cohesin complex subunit [Microbotryomycetes sp. JL221]